MDYNFTVKGHENIRSLHKSTLEFTTDSHLTLKGDCILGVNSSSILKDLPENIKKCIKTDNYEFDILLKTDNNKDVIHGFGSSKLALNHPSDMVCRKSDYICNRTLMINADKAAKDINRELINDLKKGSILHVTIRV